MLFVPGKYRSHSGLLLPGKIECDALTETEIRWFADRIVELRPDTAYSEVIGVPRGGLRIADAVRAIAKIDRRGPVLIVDDVFTTGSSVETMAKKAGVAMGAVLFAWGECPPWVEPVFQMSPKLRPKRMSHIVEVEFADREHAHRLFDFLSRSQEWSFDGTVSMRSEEDES